MIFGISFSLSGVTAYSDFSSYSYSFLAFFSLFVARKGGRKGGEGEKEDEIIRIRKKIFAKVPVWWQEKTANRATFAAET